MANVRTLAAAEYLGISRSSLEKYLCFGGGPTYSKIGRIVIYNTDDLDEWVASHRRDTTWGDTSNRTAE